MEIYTEKAGNTDRCESQKQDVEHPVLFVDIVVVL